MRTSALRTALVLALVVLLGVPTAANAVVDAAAAAAVDDAAGGPAADVGGRRLDPTSTVTEGGSVTFDARQDLADLMTAGAVAWIGPWQVSTDGGVTFVDVPGATQLVLTVDGVTLAMDGWRYRLRVVMVFAEVDPPESELRVTPAPPTVTGHPVDVTADVGDPVRFAARYGGTAAPTTTQWQESADRGLTWSDLPGATATTLDVGRVTSAMDGRRYRAWFTSAGGSVTTGSATLTVRDALAVTLHPADQSVVEGGAVTFTAAASGAAGMQWLSSTDGGSSWTWFPGETSPSLTLDPVALSSDGMLVRARFSGPFGVVHTDPATLTVLPAGPVITEQPQDQAIGLLDEVSFTVAATGADLSVQWERSSDGGSTWSAVVGNAGREWTYTARFATTNVNGQRFRAVVSNAGGEVVSDSALLTVAGSVRIVEHPRDAAVTSGQSATFRAAATVWSGAEGGLSVRWELSDDAGSTWAEAPGGSARSWTYTTPALALAQDGRRYRAVVTNLTDVAGVATDSAVVRVTTARPDVVTHPADRTVTEGGSVTFTAASDDAAPTSVLWQYSVDGSTWLSVPGGTAASLTLDPVLLAMDGWQYRARFDNAGGTRWTDPATLTVLVARPVVTEHPVDQTVVAGGSVTFTGAYGGTDAPTAVQWQVSSDGGVSFPYVGGGTSPTLVLDDVPLERDGWRYRVRFTTEAGSAWSDPATLTVLRPLPPLAVRVSPRVVLVDALPGGA